VLAIAAIVYGGVLAHTIRAFEVLRRVDLALRRSPHVHIFGSGEYLQDARLRPRDECTYHHIPQISSPRLLDAYRKGRRTPYESTDEFETAVINYTRVLGELNDNNFGLYLVDCPDQACAVALDFLVDLGIISQSKIVYVVNADWTIFRSTRLHIPIGHPFLAGLRCLTKFLGTDRQSAALAACDRFIVPFVARPAFRLAAERANRVRRRLERSYTASLPKAGRTRYRDVRQLFTGVRYNTLLFPDWNYFSPTRPNNGLYIGPISSSPRVPAPANLSAFLRRAASLKRRIVYLTMGSTGDRSILGRLLAYFGSPYNCSYAVVCNDALFEFSNSPQATRWENVYCVPFLPGEDVAKHADLLIFHGGRTTFYQMLSATMELATDRQRLRRRPMLVISTHADQEDVGRLVVSARMGMHLPTNWLKAEMAGETSEFTVIAELLGQLTESGRNPVGDTVPWELYRTALREEAKGSWAHNLAKQVDPSVHK
jgi:hypothetical protein